MIQVIKLSIANFITQELIGKLRLALLKKLTERQIEPEFEKSLWLALA